MIFANVGIPMIFVAIPLMFFMIIPVILTEFAVSHWLIPTERKRWKLLSLSLVNLISTFIGWPIAWFTILISSETISSTIFYPNTPFFRLAHLVSYVYWIPPIHDSDLNWQIYISMALLLIPFFFASVYLERWLLYAFWKKTPRATVRSFSWWSHFWSYALLYVCNFLMVLHLL